MKFELIIITSPEAIELEAKWINELFKAGLKKLHIRKPGLTKKNLEIYISGIYKKYHSNLILHSHYSLANKYSIGGLHLTERTKKKKLPTAYNKRKHILSASFHSVKDVDRARRKYDSILLSPIFDSVSKKGYTSSFEHRDLHALLQRHTNIIALGGIDHKTVVIARKMGFKGVATLGYIWEPSNPLKAFNRLKSKIK